jgi:hypothetical protein
MKSSYLQVYLNKLYRAFLSNYMKIIVKQSTSSVNNSIIKDLNKIGDPDELGLRYN